MENPKRAHFFLGIGCCVATALVAPTLLPISALAQTAPAPASDLISWALGSRTAPVTIVEYGSLTCGSCAAFSNDVKPAIKRNYVDSGRVRFIFRPFPTPPNDLSVAMHILTLCAGPNQYYPLADAFFTRQRDIFEAAVGETGPRNILFAIAEDVAGLTSTQAETCLRDPQLRNQVRTSAEAGARVGVTATPTLFINGTRLIPPAGQGYTVANVSEAIDSALRARAAQAPPPRPKSAKSPAKAKRR